MADDLSITVVSGGVGAARFLRGLRHVVPAASVTAVVNVADDMTLHGLYICPDLDTVTYTLADEIDPDRGWGLRDETWNAMATISRFGDGDWFSLGDRDLGTHLHRTQRLSEGASLTEVTAELGRGWGVEITLLPVTDDRVSTHVTLADDDREIGFQEYFVGRRHDVAISGVRFDGVDAATATPEVVDALETADLVIVAPSNPIVSIAPVLAVPGVSETLASRVRPTVAVSPIVGGRALKGPAARMLSELGHEPSAVGVARILAGVADQLVIDDVDAELARPVAAAGVTPFVTNTIMADPTTAAALASATIAAGRLEVRSR